MTTGIVHLCDGMANLATQRVIRMGREHRLTTLETRLLGYLAKHAGRDVSRAELQDKVWEYGPNVLTRAMDHTVQRLRSKIEEDSKNPRHVITVHGVGYRFVPPKLAPVDPRIVPFGERTPFVGRTAELAALRALLAERARLVTIVGPAGCGKTRLARVIAAEHAHMFFSFEGARAEHDVLQIIGAELGVPLPRRRDDVIPRLAQALDMRGVSFVVCDNFEQVAEHAPATLGALHDMLPSLELLVTSRAKLGVAVERVFELGPLDAADAAELFERCAVAAGPDAKLDEHVLGEVVACLDRLPLALELAAAHVGALSLGALLDRLRLPTAMLDTTAVGTRSMRAALDTSWEQLIDEDRAVLAGASIFRGGFTAHAAEHVLSTAALHSLERLRDRSLIQVVASRGSIRLRLLETVRVWADGKLGTGAERARVERAHADFYLETFAGSDHDLARLAQEHGNLLAISERFGVAAPALTIRAILILDPLYYARGPGYVHIEMLSRAAAAAAGGSLVCNVLVARAEAWGALGDIDAAEEDAERALLAANGQPDLEARALVARGNLRRRQARFDEAYAIYEQSRTLSVDPSVTALALRQLANCDIEVGRFAEALRRLRELEQSYLRAGDQRGVAAVLGAQGNIHNEQGEISRAERCFLAAIDIDRRIGDRRREGIAMSNMAVVLHERGQLDDARTMWERALAIHREVANRRFEGFSLGGLGVLCHEMGRCDDARLLAAEALSIFREVGDLRFEAIARARLAVLGPSGMRIRAELAAIGDLRDADAAAIRVLEGFADLADAREANECGDVARAEQALARARSACAVSPNARPTSFYRLSIRLFTSWLARWPAS